jgi:hypothetical protein
MLAKPHTKAITRSRSPSSRIPRLRPPQLKLRNLDWSIAH